MKLRDSQKGNAVTIVIIVVLVIAVLGLLGFVFWQNFVKPKAATTSANTTTTQQPTDGTAPLGDLAVKEWGVTGAYSIVSSNVDGLTYKFEKIDTSTNNRVSASADDKDAFMVVTSPALTALCGDSAGFIVSRALGTDTVYTGVGGTQTTAADIQVPNANYSKKSHVGNYYYLLSTPQGSCSDSTTDTSQADVLGAAEDFLGNLKSL